MVASFPARSVDDATRIASRWCLQSGWLDPDGDPLEFALREGGATDWTWYKAEASVHLKVSAI